MVENPDISIRIHQPSLWKQVAEYLKIREISPWDLAGQPTIEVWRAKDQDLFGDVRQFETHHDACCPAWRKNLGWWRPIVRDQYGNSGLITVEESVHKSALAKAVTGWLENKYATSI